MSADTGEIRSAIECRLGEIRGLIARLRSEDAATVTLDQTSVGRLSRMDALQQVAMSTGHQTALQRECRRLEAALDRLDAGAFGVCCKCGEAIAKSRLESDLGTPFCAGCQTEMEEKPVRPR
jgi:DnaK suppressor protein